MPGRMTATRISRKSARWGKIPAYRDERVALADSSVISFYLEKTYPKMPLYPADTVELARALWFEEFCDGALVPAMSVIYFEKFFNPTFKAEPTNEALLKEAIEVKTPPLLAYLESQLAGQWVVGNGFSIADLTIAAGFLNLELANWQIDAALYPKLTAFVKHINTRPSFVKINGIAKTFLTGVKAKQPGA